jgi:ribosomal protein S27E
MSKSQKSVNRAVRERIRVDTNGTGFVRCSCEECGTRQRVLFVQNRSPFTILCKACMAHFYPELCSIALEPIEVNE